SSSTTRMGVNVMSSPWPPCISSTSMTSPGLTFCCFPPALITAYMGASSSNVRSESPNRVHGIGRRRFGAARAVRLVLLGGEQQPPPGPDPPIEHTEHGQIDTHPDDHDHD